jgi:benzoate membrane transport protein
MGLGCVLLAVTTRLPVTTAWSTPGAALLATAVSPSGGFAEAVGAFAVAGVLLALTGVIPALGRLVRLIPTPIASAMLAGVLLSLCLAPFRDLPSSPWAIGSVLVVWALLTWWAPRWAVPGALAAALVAMAASGAFQEVAWAQTAPQLEWVTPSFSWAAVVSIALPLYLVTMTSQNIPGVTVMASLGYEVPWRPALGYTGLATVAGAPFGGHAINLAAISAALAAGPEAGRDPRGRWPAAVSAGLVYLLLGLAGGVVVALADAAPVGLFAAVAAVGLLSSLVASLQQSVADAGLRIPAVVTVVVATSGLTMAGIGSAFWALLAGCLLALLLRRRG